MEIPGPLKNEMQEGKAILFLGPGASREATNTKGDRPPDGKMLAALLSDRFLGGKFKDSPLSQVGELAISESDIITVQEYIRTIFEDFEPTPAHQLIPRFSWWAIATTNYDRLVERAYETCEKPLQQAKPFIENGDRVEDAMRSTLSVPLLKLHGCITRTSNTQCPLILSTDQYLQYRNGRGRVFDHLLNWAHERSIVFIGHSLEDHDIRAMLMELTSTMGNARPKYFAVIPEFDDVQQRYWEKNRVTLVKATFGEFMLEMNERLASSFRGLASLVSKSSMPILSRLDTSKGDLSTSCQQFLNNDVDYVNALKVLDTIEAQRFYKGVTPSWSSLESELDVRRELGDTMLSDHFLMEGSNHPGALEMLLVKAHAGAGKSVLLRRIAWDAAHEYNCLCLFMRPHGVIDVASIQELIHLSDERLFLFVDDAADRVRELNRLVSGIGSSGQRLTVVIAERINEWNVSCASLAPYVTAEYVLGYLRAKEIDSLLMLLEKHGALGTLEGLGVSARRAAFAERAGRQLLVALHEATLGRRFEDIIEDEYANILPNEAQRIYLTICVLNRLNVPVRAGIVSRLHGIPFSEFEERLFAPLEHVVQTHFDGAVRDYLYEARHPHIAQIVFERVLTKPEERFDSYVKCLSALNVDYRDDQRAYRQMVRGRNVADLFSNHDMAQQLYQAAVEGMGEDAYLLQQMALYEMHRQSGNLRRADDLLARAAQKSPNDLTIKHSMAELRLRCTEVSRTDLERDKNLKEAAAIALAISKERPEDSYGFHTLTKVGLARLEGILNAGDLESGDNLVLENAVKDVENHIATALQRFPGDPYILETDAKLATLLVDRKRAMESLKKAFENNPKSSFLAIRLSRCLRSEKNLSAAKITLQKALDAEGNHRPLHYEYAKLLLEMDNSQPDEVSYHLGRAFSRGDANYDAQLLYARELFKAGKREESRTMFQELGNARVGPDIRHKLRYPLEGIFRGTVVRRELLYCFVSRDGLNDWIYANANDIDERTWNALIVGSRVAFRIAFCLKGAGGL